MKKYALGVALLIACFGFTFSAQAEPTDDGATPMPMTGKILFAERDSETNLYYLSVINADGTGKKRLTPAFYSVMFPRYNEKTGLIGFTNKTKTMKSEVYIMNKDGSNLKKILNDASFEDFSPSGEFLLYTTCDQKSELWAYSLKQKTSIKISQDLQVTAARYAPSGDWIATSVLSSDGTNDLYLISTLAQGILRITNSDGINESFPQFSNDGKYLVYFTDRYGDNALEYMALETKELQRPFILGMYPVLSPDNLSVAYEVGPSIWVANINGLEMTFLVGDARTPFWIK